MSTTRDSLAEGVLRFVSIVIPTKNGGDLFWEVLEGIRRQEVSAPTELVVIDSGSSDGTLEVARAYGAKIISIDPDKFDHGATRNQAIQQAQGEIVVLMTQDAVPADTRLLEALLRPFSDSRVAATYARQSPRRDADILTKRNLERWLTGRLQPEIRWIKDRARYEALSPMEKYLFCNFDNVCSAIRKNACKEIPFRPSAFGEDIDWSQRVLDAGWKIAYEPKAHVIHSHDRPLSYEYKRTYMCHRKLYELFGLRTVPTRKAVLSSIAYQTFSDWKYVSGCALATPEKIAMLLKIPFLAVAGVLGQYRGARDEAMGTGRQQDGV